jgi:CheY-like chemotaxis protein/HPt (histidine-containing phosphotransfer) domain-containing protein
MACTWPSTGTSAVLNIHLADNDAADQRTLAALLRDAGHRVTVATNGREAVETIQREPINIILMHVQLPVMDGIQATGYIRRLPPPKSDIPIIALAAQTSPDATERYRIAGMDAFLCKPLHATELFHAIQQLTAPDRPPRSAVDSMPTLDESVITALHGFMSHRQVAMLLTESAADIENRVKRLAARLDTAGLADAAQEAHDLVSVAGNCGARALSTLARDIERACKQGVVADALERFMRVNEIAANAIAALNKLRAAMG